ncbi:type III pantothenate kinase [Inmirania thermothiophila]|uniref:Type III pantothenate kinase n=1 Tax=Inmirania thermothiophila TaxID=1750597 RepID=A0A3N1Y823_9GAMM|nr:type III pantothenate kinase [Inmirania thermothiophila]ROR34976.1 type III pantothenate kinase [Inmirania thermothiophila]
MILLVDIGNTHLRWGVWREGALHPGGAVARGGGEGRLREAWAGLAPPARVAVSNVGGEAAAAQVRAASLALWGLEPRLLRPTAACAGVVNAYPRPDRLGADRWAALLAARARAPQGAVVVDCGSAITVDGLDAAGRHLGGVILPGLGRMYRILAHEIGLDALPLAEAGTEIPVTDTAPAVANGALCAALGGLLRAAAAVEARLGPAPARLITGGDAVLLAPHLGPGWTLAPHLVLEGVARWALAAEAGEAG